jgi:hypothetical protein
VAQEEAMTAFRRLVGLRIAANVALGVLLLVWPALPFEWLHEPVPETLWVVRVIGVGLIYIACAHVASLVAPTLAMSSNLFVILGPILPIVLLLWVGLEAKATSRAAFLLAVYEAVFVLLLAASFQSGWLRSLATKP